MSDVDELLWVGITPPSADDIQRAERYADIAARCLADDMLKWQDDWIIEWDKTNYLERRDEEQRLRDIYDRTWKSGRFAGWRVRDDDIGASPDVTA